MAPRIDPGMDPIMQRWRENMQASMAALTKIFPNVGLALSLFDEHAGQPRANYLSNTNRRQTLAAIKEWVARQEGAALGEAADEDRTPHEGGRD